SGRPRVTPQEEFFFAPTRRTHSQGRGAARYVVCGNTSTLPPYMPPSEHARRRTSCGIILLSLHLIFCAKTTAAALLLSARLTTSRGKTDVWVSVPLDNSWTASTRF